MSDDTASADPSLRQGELQVLVVADLVKAPHVAHIVGLPELIAESVVDHVLHDPMDFSLFRQLAPAGLDALLGECIGLARFWASIGYQESCFGAELEKDGSGDGEHGWGPWQGDIRTHAQLVAAIRACVPFSPEWWAVSCHGCLPIALAAAQEYPGNVEACACRYNCRKDLVDAGLTAGDPNVHTTHSPDGRGYGEMVMGRIQAWWPSA